MGSASGGGSIDCAGGGVAAAFLAAPEGVSPTVRTPAALAATTAAQIADARIQVRERGGPSAFVIGPARARTSFRRASHK
ncbi:hypothetical protein GCM10009850_041680 [Nonomuraea monospora]|uniref:Uncharacterized protein n=1 Tax=Nonomuraea monospora TaxID=568818 RepID=A0ABN3CH70_9ACTN